jgi:hypothetical protein
MKTRYVVSMIFVVLVAFSIVGATSAHEGVRHFVVDLESLNDSGVSGMAELTLDGDELTVKIEATGLEMNRPHPQHIHGLPVEEGKGFANPRNSTCPTAAADADGDGVVSVGEGLSNYGPVRLALTPFSTTPDGTLDFEVTYPVPDALQPINTLQNRVIVLHGLTIDGAYVPSTPIACGQIRPAPNRP